MPKTLPFLLFLLSFSVGAQNWMPFNPNDSIWHFVSESSIQTFSSTGPADAFRPVQSIVVTNQFNSGNQTQLKFKKGFNYQRYNSLRPQIIKGQIFGDSALIGPLETQFFSRDLFGFRLSFPHQYSLHDTLIIGSSLSNLLKGVIDSLYTGTVNGQNDSLVRVFQTVYDTSGLRDTSHLMDGSFFVLSKNHGMIKCPNYTELEVLGYFEKYFRPNDRIYQGENHQLEVGSEIHWRQYNQIGAKITDSLIISNVDSIATNGSQKEFFFSHYGWLTWQPNNPINYSQSSYVIDTSQFFTLMESNTISDSVMLFLSHMYNFPLFGFDKGVLNYYLNDSPYLINTFNLPFLKDSLLILGNGLAGLHKNRLIGVWQESHQWGMGGVGASHITSIVNHYQIKNNSWGIPHNLPVGIKKLFTVDKVKIYPNPSSQRINIQTEISFESIEIQNLNGQVIKQIPFALSADISDLATGVYIIKLIGENQSLVQKFIVQ